MGTTGVPAKRITPRISLWIADEEERRSVCAGEIHGTEKSTPSAKSRFLDCSCKVFLEMSRGIEMSAIPISKDILMAKALGGLKERYNFEGRGTGDSLLPAACGIVACRV
jgi:hypothetical protein